MSGWFGNKLAFLKCSVSLKSSSDYFSRKRCMRINAKPFIESPISGWFGGRLAFLKLNVSLNNS